MKTKAIEYRRMQLLAKYRLGSITQTEKEELLLIQKEQNQKSPRTLDKVRSNLGYYN